MSRLRSHLYLQRISVRNHTSIQLRCSDQELINLTRLVITFRTRNEKISCHNILGNEELILTLET